MENGPKYIISKEGILKILVLAFGCAAFALYADSGKYRNSSLKTYILAAYIISWSISFLFFFFHLIGLASKMNCGRNCTYNGFDFLWSWLSTINFLAASSALAINPYCDITLNTKSCNLQAGAIALGFATFVAYAVEAYFLRSYAPANAGYIASWKGWFKTIILIGGAASFSLLVDSGYNWCPRNRTCSQAVTYALSAFCIGWGGSVLIFFANMFLSKQMSEKKAFTVFEFIWSVLSALLFFSASSCFAAFMKTNSSYEMRWEKRLAGVIIGFITAVLYTVDAILNRPKK